MIWTFINLNNVTKFDEGLYSHRWTIIGWKCVTVYKRSCGLLYSLYIYYFSQCVWAHRREYGTFIYTLETRCNRGESSTESINIVIDMTVLYCIARLGAKNEGIYGRREKLFKLSVWWLYAAFKPQSRSNYSPRGRVAMGAKIKWGKKGVLTDGKLRYKWKSLK